MSDFVCLFVCLFVSVFLSVPFFVDFNIFLFFFYVNIFNIHVRFISFFPHIYIYIYNFQIYFNLMQFQLHLRQSHSKHERSFPPEETAIRRIISGQRSQGGQKKRFIKTLRVSMKSFGIAPNCREYLAQACEKSGVKLLNMDQKYVKPEEMHQLSCAGNLEKALLHLTLPPPFLVFTAQDSSAHRLVSFAIYTLTDVFLNQNGDNMVLIDYDWQRRRYHRYCHFPFFIIHIFLSFFHYIYSV